MYHHWCSGCDDHSCKGWHTVRSPFSNTDADHKHCFKVASNQCLSGVISAAVPQQTETPCAEGMRQAKRAVRLRRPQKGQSARHRPAATSRASGQRRNAARAASEAVSARFAGSPSAPKPCMVDSHTPEEVLAA